jgi:hypothetical protein
MDDWQWAKEKVEWWLYVVFTRIANGEFPPPEVRRVSR